MRVLRDRFPGLNDLKPASGWTGRVALSADTLPFYRFVDGHANIVTAGGYGGHGIAMASYAGQILARMLTQDPYEDAEPFVHRKRIPLPPEPFKWVLSRAMKIGMAFADNSADKRFRSAAAARHKTHLQPGNH
jgi:glycine/D-amino acid oxidase-like deaminating enzyme